MIVDSKEPESANYTISCLIDSHKMGSIQLRCSTNNQSWKSLLSTVRFMNGDRDTSCSDEYMYIESKKESFPDIDFLRH